MDDIPLCPPWWPELLWRLHFPIPVPGGPIPGPDPVNFPPLMNDILANLAIHTMSYHILDKDAGEQVRKTAQDRLMESVQNLSQAR